MIRKTIAVLICIFMIVLTFQGTVVAQEPNFKQKAAQLCRDGYLGDFNKDGKVRINDVRSALRVAIGLDVSYYIFSFKQSYGAERRTEHYFVHKRINAI